MRLFFIIILFSIQSVKSQIPQGIPYQAVARNAQGQPLNNQTVKVRFSILDSTAIGNPVYVESHTTTTSSLGLFNLNVGMGTASTGTFSAINWGVNFKFLKVELDTTATGNNYIDLGTQQMMSVPYALWANNGVPSGGNQGYLITMCNGEPIWTQNGRCPARVNAIDCNSSVINGTIYLASTNVSASCSINYYGGNGGEFNTLSYSSYTINGLTATLSAGTILNGNGSIVLAITGTPSDTGIAFFTINFGGQSCTLSIPVISTNVDALSCSNIIWSDTVFAEDSISNLTGTIPYIGGNGGPVTEQTVNSSGVTGLICTLQSGLLNTGAGTLNLSLSGIAADTGSANFNITVGGQSCTITIPVAMNPASTGTCGAYKLHNPNLSYSSVTDQDGNTYKTIIIGNQEWMAENLKTSKYQNGDPILDISDQGTWNGLTAGASCWYGNDSLTYSCPFGKLYNGYAVFGSKNICPSGWHIPTEVDWNTLTNQLTSSGQNAGSSIAASGNYWFQQWGISGTNTSGLSLIPGGIRDAGGNFSSNGSYGYFWINYSGQPNYGIFSYPYYSGITGFGSTNGLSIRCMKSGPGTTSISSIDCPNFQYNNNIYSGQPIQNSTPMITVPYNGGNGGYYTGQTINSTGVYGITATLNPGQLSYGNGYLYYALSGTPNDTGMANFTINIAGQSCSFSLHIRGAYIDSFDCNNVSIPTTPIYAGYAVNNLMIYLPYFGGTGAPYNSYWYYQGNGLYASLQPGVLNNGNGVLYLTVYGVPNAVGQAIIPIYFGGQYCNITIPISDPTSLTTNSCGISNIHNPFISYGTLLDQDSNSYKTVYINGQEWMAENLKAFRYSNGDTIPEITDPTNWSTLTTGAVTSVYNSNGYDCNFGKLYNWYAVADPRNVCPVGWRVPSDADWNNLNYFTSTNPQSIQSASYWPNSYYNNSTINTTGFSAIPAGYRNWDGNFNNYNQNANWWSATLNSPNTAFQRVLSYTNYYNYTFSNQTTEKASGLSIRCVR